MTPSSPSTLRSADAARILTADEQLLSSKVRSDCQKWKIPRAPKKWSFSPPVLPQSPQELGARIDHTLLLAHATLDAIHQLCEEARQAPFYCVCVNSSWVAEAKHYLSRPGDPHVISVVGFPLGAASTSSKVAETQQARLDGASEIDVVIHLGHLKSGHLQNVFEDLQAVVIAAHPLPVKVILETAQLDTHQKIIACVLATEAGAAFVKTSTGMGGGGATSEDIQLMRAVVGSLGVKASGGIRTWTAAREMILSGADRLGTSQGNAILAEFKNEVETGSISSPPSTDRAHRTPPRPEDY